MNAEKNQNCGTIAIISGHDVISGSDQNTLKLNVSWLKGTVPFILPEFRVDFIIYLCVTRIPQNSNRSATVTMFVWKNLE